MTERIDYAYQIKQSITMRDACEMYGYPVNRSNKAVCPFHNDKNASMHVYPGSRGFYCFSCGAHGDVIDFVSQLFGLDFQNALRKLNDDFSLGLPLGSDRDTEERRKAAEKARQLRIKREAEKRRRNALENEYKAALDDWVRLDRIVQERAPSMDSILDMDLNGTDSDWTDALAALASATNRLQMAELACAEAGLQH